MSLQLTPSGERIHIGFFGVRNAGKSSLVNAVIGQDFSVVSPERGTTTDPVRKAMELLPLGPVLIIDTPGIDDAGALGELRVRKARETLRHCDIAVLVVDATLGLQKADQELIALFEERNLPHLIVYNKADLLDPHPPSAGERRGLRGPTPARRDGDDAAPHLLISALEGSGVHELKEALADLGRKLPPEKQLVGDLIEAGDLVVLVVPIDESAPKGRLILPQQLVLRDVLDHHGRALVCQPGELARSLGDLTGPPRLVITDSQAFAQVAATVPEPVPLTSFSILMARYKSELPVFLDGVGALRRLTDKSAVLVAEGCTHHRQCEDIGTVKIPRWIHAYTGATPRLDFCSGTEFPDDLTGYDLVLHCGACMLNEKEMAHRLMQARRAGVPIVNYGMAIAAMNGMLERALQPLGGMPSLAKPSRSPKRDEARGARAQVNI